MTDLAAIDWPAVHQKLEHGTQLLEEAFHPPQERVSHMLAQRAEVLASRPQAAAALAQARRTLLLLEIGSHVAGVEVHWVREVVSLTRGHAPVPDADERLLGVINVHNHIVNLVNPWPLLNEPVPASTGSSNFGMAVLLRHSQLSVAIACSQVLTLVDLPEQAWQGDNIFLFGADQRPGVLLDVPALLLPWEQQAQKAP